MKARISSDELGGSVSAPSSKSYSQRYILMAGMGSSPVKIHGIHFSEDEQVAIGIIRGAGSVLTFEGDTLTIEPNFSCPKYVDVGESATSYRLSLGLLTAMKCRTEFVGRPELARRPMNELVEAIRSLGGKVDVKDDGFVALDAEDIRITDLQIDQSRSSQYVSSLLLLLAFGGMEGGKLTVKGARSSEGYVNITISCLKSMGYQVALEDGTYTVSRTETDLPKDIYIERDYSSAAFFLVLGVLASDQGISLEGLPDNSLQADAIILDLLKASTDGISVVFADNKIIAKAVRGYVKHLEVDAKSTPDLAPPMAVLGIFSKEGVTIRNPSRLSIKESDRYSEIIRLVESFGARVEEGEDYLLIKGGHEVLNPGSLDFNDHRMVMSAIIAGLASGFDIEYGNIERINKSYPSFLGDLRKIGAVIRTDISL